MRIHNGLKYGGLVFLLLVTVGCARAAKDTTGFPRYNSKTVEASFEDTWQTVKTVLREQNFDLYTRDKRGVFVAYTEPKRRLLKFFKPRRVQYTIELEAVSDHETAIYVETLQQVYGVTPLTYPDWHDRKTEDDTQARVLLDAIQARLAS